MTEIVLLPPIKSFTTLRELAPFTAFKVFNGEGKIYIKVMDDLANCSSSFVFDTEDKTVDRWDDNIKTVQLDMKVEILDKV